ncbi:hypothetical protein WJX77_003182 [Trebouxia sp. C0004]
MIKMHHSRPRDRTAKPFRALEDIMQEEQAAAAPGLQGRQHEADTCFFYKPKQMTGERTDNCFCRSSLSEVE